MSLFPILIAIAALFAAVIFAGDIDAAHEASKLEIDQ